MATFSLDIPDDVVSRVVDALAGNYNYRAQIPNPDNPGEMIDNPQSKVDFGMDQIRAFLILNVHSYEVNEAAKEATANVLPIEL